MKILKFLFSRLVIVGVILALQVAWFLVLVVKLSYYSTIINLLLLILSILVVLWVVNKQDNPAYKLAWVIPILSFPILGGLLYLTMGDKKPSKRFTKKLDREYGKSKSLLLQSEDILEELKELDITFANQVKYINNAANFPIHKGTYTEYYKSGEENFEVMKKELEKATKFIFMEYFIIEEGVMWNSILEILERKAKEGVDVRLIYDDVGCLSVLPYKYYKKIESMGIKCEAFNHYVPIFSVAMNNRDHRKITVIDGHTAFSGGINLADEYINVKTRFKYWKDTGIMLKGDGVWNYTVMFLQMWNAIRPTDEDYSIFKPNRIQSADADVLSDGYVQPYGDSPLDEETIGETVYMNIINGAKKYVYIFTPYLIIDNELMTALTVAAKKGVDVRIVTPGVPDKKLVYLVTQSYYKQLIEAGVRIYQYTPGFIHAKCFVCDDEIATVGTINLDYRSLYLHFECGTLLYKTKSVLKVKEDALETISVSEEITKDHCDKNIVVSLLQAVLRLFAPLL